MKKADRVMLNTEFRKIQIEQRMDLKRVLRSSEWKVLRQQNISPSKPFFVKQTLML